MLMMMLLLIWSGVLIVAFIIYFANLLPKKVAAGGYLFFQVVPVCGHLKAFFKGFVYTQVLGSAEWQKIGNNLEQNKTNK